MWVGRPLQSQQQLAERNSKLEIATRNSFDIPSLEYAAHFFLMCKGSLIDIGNNGVGLVTNDR
jgi:hypothetical protein